MASRNVKFELKYVEEVDEHGTVEQWPVLTWTWDGGSITIKDWEPVELNGIWYVPETAWNPLVGFDEQDEGGIVVLFPAWWENSNFNASPSGTVTGAVIHRDGTVYPTRTTHLSTITIKVPWSDAWHKVECHYGATDNALLQLLTHGATLAYGDASDAVHRNDNIDWGTRWHVSQLVQDVELDPDVWGGLFD